MRTDSGAPTGSAPGENRGGEENASDLLLKVPGVSLRIASQRTGFSCAYLKELCREECAALGSWYVCWRHEASERRKMGLFQEVRNAVRQLHDEGNGPTVKRVMSLLPTTALREWKTLTNSRSESRQTSNRKRMRLTEVSVGRISNRARARDPV